jgi:hypothetical protein
MEVMYPQCCGLDVHKSSITACVLLAQSGKPLKHIRRFGCTTRELRELVVWLQEFGVEHVAMESTGVYWKPVWNILEGHFQILLANAQHIKAVPGRKTDTKDLSRLFRNVPILNSIEMSPCWVEVIVGMRTEAKPCFLGRSGSAYSNERGCDP